MNSVILSAAARLLVALILLFSLFLLLRGHNEPGGGFIGGLVAATAYALYAKARGTEQARAALHIEPRTLALWGLGAAAVAGMLAWLAGQPFLTGLWWIAEAADGTKGMALSTVLLFDIGVYLVVVGSVLTFFFGLDSDGQE